MMGPGSTVVMFYVLLKQKVKHEMPQCHGYESLMTRSRRYRSLRLGQSERSRTLLLLKHKGDVNVQTVNVR